MSITFRLVVILGILLGAVESWAAAQPVGKAASVSGTVTLQRGGKNYRLAQGTALYNGDTVVTPKNTVAKLLMSDDSLVTVGSRSKFLIENFATGKQGRTGSFRLLFGKMRAIVSKYTSGKSDIRFSTPTAVAGVRGTHLVVQYDANTQQTVVSVLEGSVGFRAINQPGGEVVLGARQQSVQSGNDRASAPRPIPDSALQDLDNEIKDQTPGTQGEDEGESKKTEGTDGDTTPNGGDSSSEDGDGAASGESEQGDAGEGTEGNLDQNLNRIDGANQQGANPLEENNPAVNPAADTGVRVRW